MHADQGGPGPAQAPVDQRDVVVALEHALIKVELELALGRGQRHRDHAAHQYLAAAAPRDQVPDRENAEPMTAREALELGQPRHAAVIGQDLAQRADRLEPGECAQVGHRLAVAGAAQHPARHGAEREHMARAHQVVGPGARIGECAQRARAIERRGAGGGALARVHRFGERGAEARGIALDHEPEPQPVGVAGGHGRAQDAAPVLDGEVDVRGRGLLRRPHDVALVLPQRVIHHDHHLARTDAPDSLIGGEEHLGACGLPRAGARRRSARGRGGPAAGVRDL